MQDVAKNLPDLIKAAASSNLGIVALMLVVFSGLAYLFFREAKEIWRFSALALLFGGCISFGYAVFSSAQQTLYEARSVDNRGNIADRTVTPNSMPEASSITIIKNQNKFPKPTEETGSHSDLTNSDSIPVVSSQQRGSADAGENSAGALPGPILQWQGMADDEDALVYKISIREPVTVKFEMANQASWVIGELMNADDKTVKDFQFYPGASIQNDLIGQFSQFMTPSDYRLRIRCRDKGQATPFKLYISSKP